MDSPILSAEAYALAQTWVPRMAPEGGEHRCAAHAGPIRCSVILIEWQRFPRPWQVELFGQVLEDSAVWLCPNAWYALQDLVARARHEPTILTPVSEARGQEIPYWAWRLGSEALHCLDAAISQQPEHAKCAPTACPPDMWRCSLCGGRMHYARRGFWHACNGAKAAESAGPGREGTESPTHGESPTAAADVARSRPEED